MARKPRPRWDEGANQFRVDINYKRHYLGRDPVEADRRFHELMIAPPKSKTRMYVAEVIDRYKQDREKYFADSPSSWDCGRLTMRLLNHMYGKLPIDELGPMQLRAMRERMLTGKDPKTGEPYDLTREGINRRINQVVRFLRWAVSWELASNETLQRCSTLDPLMPGRCNARETVPIGSAKSDSIKVVLDLVPPSVAIMIRLQALTAARPGEMRNLTPECIDRTETPWKADLVRHKTAHHGNKRIIFFGPEAREILAPLLPKTKPGEPLFPNENGTAYTKDSYAQAVRRACKKAGCESFTPNMLRHMKLTMIETEYGREAVQGIAGHASLKTAEWYVGGNLEKARRIAEEKG